MLEVTANSLGLTVAATITVALYIGEGLETLCIVAGAEIVVSVVLAPSIIKVKTVAGRRDEWVRASTALLARMLVA